MFLSGYVYSMNGEWKSKGTKISFILNKTISLGIPYILFTIVYFGINSMVSGTNHSFTVNDLAYIWNTPIAQYWFLYALLILFICWVLLSNFLRNWQITLMLILLYYMLSMTNCNLAIFQRALGYSFAFGLGTMTKSFFIDRLSLEKRLTLIITHITLTLTIIYLGFNGRYIFNEIEQLLGIIGSIAFITLIYHLDLIQKILLLLCKYSFPIYLLHTIFTAAVRIFLFKTGISNYYCHVILGVIAGILGPLIIAFMTTKFRILDFAFYPNKYIRIEKNNSVNLKGGVINK